MVAGATEPSQVYRSHWTLVDTRPSGHRGTCAVWYRFLDLTFEALRPLFGLLELLCLLSFWVWDFLL